MADQDMADTEFVLFCREEEENEQRMVPVSSTSAAAAVAPSTSAAATVVPSTSAADAVGSSMSAPSTSATQRPRGRGPTRGLKLQKEDQISLLWDQYGRYGGGSRSEFGSMLGTLARSHCCINHTWKQVPQEVKETIWKKVQERYKIPEEVKKTVLSLVAGKAKSFRHYLVEHWINRVPPREPPPYVVYNGMITEEEWKEFVERHATPEFRQVQEQARQNREANLYPHTMGRRGYVGSLEGWKEAGLLTRRNEDGSECPIEDVSEARRVQMYILGRQKTTSEGQRIFPNAAMEQLANQIYEAAQRGEVDLHAPPSQDDALNQMLGKKDHPGRVRGFGGEVRQKNVFPPSARKDQMSAAEVKAMVEHKFAAERQANDEKQAAERRTIEERLQEALNAIAHATTQQQQLDPPRLSSSSSCAPAADLYPFANIQEQKKCRLQIPLDGHPVDAAYGTVLPSGPLTLISFVRLPPFYARVTLDLIVDGFEHAYLPMAFDNKCTLIEAKGDILPWPACYIVVTDEIPELPRRVTRPRLEETSAPANPEIPELPRRVSRPREEEICAPVNPVRSTRGKNPVSRGAKGKNPAPVRGRTRTSEAPKNKLTLPQKLVNVLGPKQMNLYDKIMLKSSQTNNFMMTLPKSMFHYEEDMMTAINFEDIREMMCGDYLNINIIQAYLKCLLERYAEKDMTSITAVCPERLSYDSVTRDPGRFCEYMIHCFNVVDQQNKLFILMPYHQTHHWALFIFCAATATLLVLDPLGQWTEFNTEDLIKDCYKKTPQGEFGDLTVNYIKCPTQKDSKSCGYYVMRYMYEFCGYFPSFKNDIDKIKEHYARFKTYAPADLLHVRESMAAMFMRMEW